MKNVYHIRGFEVKVTHLVSQAVTESPVGYWKWEMKRGSVSVWACSLIFLRALKAGRDMIAQRPPLGLTLSESWSYDQRRSTALCFSQTNKKEKKRKPLRSASHSAPPVVTAGSSHSWKVQNFTYRGSCHPTSRRGRQHFWQGICASLKSGERQEVDESGKNMSSLLCEEVNRSCWRCSVRLIQAVILNIHLISSYLNMMVLHLRRGSSVLVSAHTKIYQSKHSCTHALMEGGVYYSSHLDFIHFQRLSKNLY